MELETFNKAQQIVTKIREYENYIKNIKNIINANNFEDFRVSKTYQEGLRNFDIGFPLTDSQTRGLLISIYGTYKGLICELYEELEKL